MRAPLLLPLLAAVLLAGCTGEPRGPVGRDDLAFPVVSSVGGAAPDEEGAVTLAGEDGVQVRAANGTLAVGLAGAARASIFHACDGACRAFTLPEGVVLGERALISLGNVSLNAVGPDRDSAVLFHDEGIEGGRFLRWNDLLSRFQVNADLQAVGNLTATHHVGTTTLLARDDPTLPFVTVSTAATEGVEVTVFARGSAELVDGEALVRFPSAFSALAGGPVTAQVTLTSPGPALYVAEKSSQHVLVRAADGSAADATFDWFVQAARAGSDGFEP